jgi:hypothetical protein
MTDARVEGRLSQRDYREGWPLPNVETEAMGTQGVHMKGALP